MKLLLILLVSFAFGQDIDTIIIDNAGINKPTPNSALEGFGEYNDLTVVIPLETKPLLDFTLQTPTTQCFQILLQFQDGWLENMVDMRDSIICPNMIDVRIEHEGIIQDYTMEEFLERLGFEEIQ